MTNKKLILFIKTARKKGFDDIQIKEPLLKKGWPAQEIENAFAVLSKRKIKFKNEIHIFVDSDVLRIIEKRAKKNLFTINEQIEDILRRSCLNSKKNKGKEEKIDDLLVSLFSRNKLIRFAHSSN
jgi:hypothetical protein